MKRLLSRTAIACSLLVLAACGGGAGTGSSALPGQSPARGASSTGTAVFTVSIPQRSAQGTARKPKYLTPAVQGIDFTVTAADPAVAPLNRGYVFYALSALQTYCSSSGGNLTCVLPVQAMPGADLITVKTYDGQNPNNSYIVSTGYVTATIAAGAETPIHIVTNGSPLNITASLDNPFPVPGTPLTQPVHITATDSDNYVIIGNYDMPLIVSNSDASAHVSLSTNSVASSAVVPNLIWDGVALTGADTMKVELNSPTAAWNNGAPIDGIATFNPGGSGIVSSPANLSFAHTNSIAQTISISGPGTTPPYHVYYSSADKAGDRSCAGIAMLTGSTGNTFTISPVGAGTCWLDVKDSSGTPLDYGVPVTVSP